MIMMIEIYNKEEIVNDHEMACYMECIKREVNDLGLDKIIERINKRTANKQSGNLKIFFVTDFKKPKEIIAYIRDGKEIYISLIRTMEYAKTTTVDYEYLICHYLSHEIRHYYQRLNNILWALETSYGHYGVSGLKEIRHKHREQDAYKYMFIRYPYRLKENQIFIYKSVQKLHDRLYAKKEIK